MSKEIILTIAIVGLLTQYVIWSITDPRPLKQRLDYYISHKRRALYVKVVAFLLIYLASSFYLTWPSTDRNALWNFLGLMIYISGMLLGIWAKLTMKTAWGPPAQHENKNQNALITNGPFLYTRNPIYMGLFLMFIGFSIAMRSYSLILCGVVYYFIWAAVLIEEDLLRKHFGKKYEEYTAKVPRFI